jgi:hypothetical protein
VASSIDRRTPATSRRRAYRIVAGVFGGLGLVASLAFMLFAPFATDPVGMAHRLHNTAGSVGTALLGFSLVVCAVRPSRTNALAAVCAASVASLLGGLLGGDLFTGFWFIGPLVAVALIVLTQERDQVTRRLDMRLLLLAALAMVPVLVYALTQTAFQRTAHDVHAQNHHYSGMAISAMIVVMTAAGASLRTRGWWLTAWSAAIAAVVGGAFAVAYHDAPSAPGPAWAWLAIAWGLAVALVVRITPDPTT